jgi:hypothetical protein
MRGGNRWDARQLSGPRPRAWPPSPPARVGRAGAEPRPGTSPGASGRRTMPRSFRDRSGVSTGRWRPVEHVRPPAGQEGHVAADRPRRRPPVGEVSFGSAAWRKLESHSGPGPPAIPSADRPHCPRLPDRPSIGDMRGEGKSGIVCVRMSRPGGPCLPASPSIRSRRPEPRPRRPSPAIRRRTGRSRRSSETRRQTRRTGSASVPGNRGSRSGEVPQPAEGGQSFAAQSALLGRRHKRQPEDEGNGPAAGRSGGRGGGGRQQAGDRRCHGETEHLP